MEEKTIEQINEELETWNILFDILIDEERLIDEIAVDFNSCNPKNDIEEMFDRDIKKGQILNYLTNIEVNVHYIRIQISRWYDSTTKVLLYPNMDKFWRYLFLAKYVRAILQQIGSTKALKKIDEVAEYLLSKISFTYTNNSSERPYEFGGNKFRTLFYNEISQCYNGYLSTGFAEKALKQYLPGECHYELLGLYNKAVGLAHHENRNNREKAIKYYDIIINWYSSENHKKDNYKYKYDEDLWIFYLYIPALLQKVDVLIKLQRGQESIIIINKTISLLSGLKNICRNYIQINPYYKLLESIILKAQANIEAGYIFDDYLPPLSILQSIIISKCRIIKNKYNSLIAKHNIEMVILGTISCEDDIEKKINKSLKICYNIYNSEDNDQEQVLAALYWLEALKTKISFLDIKSIEYDKIFLKEILNFIIIALDKEQKNKNDFERWIPVKDKVIKLLIEVLETINNCYDSDPVLKKLEIQFCKVLLTTNSLEQSNYNKVKLCRRTILLGDEISNNYNVFKFPEFYELELVREFANSRINKDFYIRQLRYNTETFDEKLIYKSYWPKLKNNYAFTCLRKWQSYTPSLGSYSATSRGGGYFVYKVGGDGCIEEGIIVDPGYDFIENFFEHKFSVSDINAIAFTHSHIDHSVDFRGIITLVREMNNRLKNQKQTQKTHKVRVILTPSCFDLFYLTINDCREFIEDVVVVDPGIDDKLTPINLNNFIVRAVPAYHKEIQNNANCVGIIIENKDYRENNKMSIGFTGDTVWTQNMINNFIDCSVVCANMGSILDVRKGHYFEKTYKDANEIKKLIYEQNHLYLPGTLAFLEGTRKSSRKTKKIIIIGELGEELKSGLRKDLFYKFNELLSCNNKDHRDIALVKAVMEDIGLTIIWCNKNDPSFQCFRCKETVEHDKLMIKVNKDIRGGEQLCYYCDDCLKILENMETGEGEHWQMRY